MNKNEFYVLHYDVETGEYFLPDFTDFYTAMNEYMDAKPVDKNDRVELMYAPINKKNDNVVIISKGAKPISINNEESEMEKTELLELLKDDNQTLYTKVNDNYERMSKDQLKEIILALHFVIRDYINNYKLEKLAMNDIVIHVDKWFEDNSSIEIQ